MLDNIFNNFENTLSELIFLSIENNQLTEFPSSIEKLKKLETLNISGNNITTIPEFIGDLSFLKIIDLKSNFLTKLPLSITRLSNLRELDVRYNTPLLLSQKKEIINKLPQTCRVAFNDPIEPSQDPIGHPDEPDLDDLLLGE